MLCTRARKGRNESATTSVAAAVTQSEPRPTATPGSERDRDVRRREQQGQRAVDGRAVDEALDRVQPVADDGDPDGDRQRRPASAAGSRRPARRRRTGTPMPQPAKQVSRPSGNQERRPGDPERLQPLDARRAAQPQPDRDRAREQAAQDADPERHPDPRRASPGWWKPAIGFVHCRIAAGRTGRCRAWRRSGSDEAKTAPPSHPAPAAAEQAPVREDKCDRDRPGIEQGPQRAAELQRPAHVGDEEVEGRRRDGAHEQDPRDHVARLPDRDQQADDGRREGDERRRRTPSARRRSDGAPRPSTRPAKIAHVVSATAHAVIRRIRTGTSFAFQRALRNRCQHRTSFLVSPDVPGASRP